MKEAKRNIQELINQYLFKTYDVDKKKHRQNEEGENHFKQLSKCMQHLQSNWVIVVIVKMAREERSIWKKAK